MSVKDECAIHIVWRSGKLEKLSATDREGTRYWGAKRWPVLKRRLAMLAAATTLSEMRNLPGRCHQLGADRAGEFALDLWGPSRLIFEPDHDPCPRLADGGIDQDNVTRIRILEVVDYHGD